jgi:hypothetical protein
MVIFGNCEFSSWGEAAMKKAGSTGKTVGQKAAVAKKATAGKKVPSAAKKAGVVGGIKEGFKLKSGIYQRDDIKKKPTVASSKPIPTIKITEGLGSAREEVGRLI